MITLIVTAEFLGMRPAHHRHIVKQGSGGTAKAAAAEAWRAIFSDDRLKGKRVAGLMPCKATVTIVSKVEDE